MASVATLAKTISSEGGETNPCATLQTRETRQRWCKSKRADTIRTAGS